LAEVNENGQPSAPTTVSPIDTPRKAGTAGRCDQPRKDEIDERLLLVSAALVALTGAAFAQQSPVLQGSYSANVAENYGDDAPNTGAGLIDLRQAGASMRNFVGDIDGSLGIEADSSAKSGALTGDLADREDSRGR
jgi:hypothetical protein